MNQLPILYRAAVYLDHTRREILGPPRENYEQASNDIQALAGDKKAKVILILRSDRWPINAGQFYLHRILK